MEDIDSKMKDVRDWAQKTFDKGYMPPWVRMDCKELVAILTRAIRGRKTPFIITATATQLPPDQPQEHESLPAA